MPTWCATVRARRWTPRACAHCRASLCRSPWQACARASAWPRPSSGTRPGATRSPCWPSRSPPAILLVWTFGFISRYDHWPLGEGWALLLGGSLVAVVGAALERGRLVAAGALAVFAAAASPYLGFGTGTDFTGTPSFYHGWGVDIGVASLLPTLLLVAAGLSLPRGGRPLRAAHARLAAGLAPAVIAAVYLFPGPSREPTIVMTHFSPGEKASALTRGALPDALDPGIEAAAADPRPRTGRGGRPHVEKGSHAPRAGTGQRARAAERGVPTDLGPDPHRRAGDNPVPGSTTAPTRCSSPWCRRYLPCISCAARDGLARQGDDAPVGEPCPRSASPAGSSGTRGPAWRFVTR